jgi:hypothetical protein
LVTDTVSLPVADTAAGPADQIRFRASRAQAMFIALPFCFIAIAQAAEYLLLPAHSSARGSEWLYLIAVALLVPAICAQAWFGATLTSDGVIVHGLRSRIISWHDVTCIRAEEFAANRVIAVYEFGSRRTRLRYPTSGALFADPQFEAKLALIQDWWADCSGRDRP